MILITLSALILLAYISYSLYKLEDIPSSISETYYYNSKWTFPLVMLVAGLLILPKGLEIVENTYGCLFFFACVGVLLVGVTPDYKSGMQKTLHTFGAAIALISSHALLAFSSPIILCTWLFYIPIFGIYMVLSKGTFKERISKCDALFWAEVITLIMIYLRLYEVY